MVDIKQFHWQTLCIKTESLTSGHIYPSQTLKTNKITNSLYPIYFFEVKNSTLISTQEITPNTSIQDNHYHQILSKLDSKGYMTTFLGTQIIVTFVLIPWKKRNDQWTSTKTTVLIIVVPLIARIRKKTYTIYPND